MDLVRSAGRHVDRYLQVVGQFGQGARPSHPFLVFRKQPISKPCLPELPGAGNTHSVYLEVRAPLIESLNHFA